MLWRLRTSPCKLSRPQPSECCFSPNVASRFIAQDRSDNNKQIVSAEETDGFNSDNPLASEIEQSKAALALLRCPPPSQIFQGQQDILEKMTKYFSTDPGQRHTYVLHGLGGSGKTQIALKFLEMMNRYQTPR
ncbi:hypothetical protein B0H14DRAFT_2372438 [Mycena olivaceomarginata]|nr:hypothetical protein B0H14DRAFT_2372438 [Mycena olivaceomarginata]